MARERSEFSGAMLASTLLHAGVIAAALISWPWARQLPMGGAVSNVAGANWALIGDAAACINPLNGEGIDYGLEYLKLVVKEMPTIPMMSYNVFTSMDTTYWTGYPTFPDDPYTDPVPNWGNSRLMMIKLKPTQP